MWYKLIMTRVFLSHLVTGIGADSDSRLPRKPAGSWKPLVDERTEEEQRKATSGSVMAANFLASNLPANFGEAVDSVW